MQTIFNSKKFQSKIKGKYSLEYIEDVCEKISSDPKIGEKFINVNNIYKLNLGLTLNKKAEYNLIYFYQSKNEPIFVINIFKNKEKDILSKVINILILENV